MVLDIKRCYCENKNGGIGKNGIVCVHDNNTHTTTSCEQSEGCIGTTKAKNTLMNPRLLCEKGNNVISIVSIIIYQIVLSNKDLYLLFKLFIKRLWESKF